MLNEKNTIILRKIATRLRELKPILERIERETTEEMMLLPERLWRSEIDDDIGMTAGMVEEAVEGVDEAIKALLKAIGEEEEPVRREAAPLSIPTTREESDDRRRQLAADIRERRAIGG